MGVAISAILVQFLINVLGQLWDAIAQNDSAMLETLLADDFVWVSPGCVHDKSAALKILAESHVSTYWLEDISARKLTKTTGLIVSLATCHEENSAAPEHVDSHVHHASVWVLRDQEWQLAFHQETPTR